MKYNSVTYNYDKKNNRYRFFYEAEYFENGHHIQIGNLFDVYIVNNHYVVMKCIGGMIIEMLAKRYNQVNNKSEKSNDFVVGKLEAKEKHLEDMRTIAMKMIDHNVK